VASTPDRTGRVTKHRKPQRRTLRYPLLAGVVGGGAAIVIAVVSSGSSDGSPARTTTPAPTAAVAAAPASSASTSTGSSPGSLPRVSVIGAAPAAGSSAVAPSPPVRVSIPAIHVDSGLQRLGREADGTLQPPTKWAVAGWYAGGVIPGQVGPAVITGHVDSTSGPAVFFRLSKLAIGDRVTVDAADGSHTTFVVDRIQRFVKAHFPTEQVYGPVPVPELRLVTCTGRFDRAARSYDDNLVVSAHLV
jgi:Sortase domain